MEVHSGGQDSTRQLFPLTGVRVGVWRPHGAWSSYLLVLPAAQKFVVLLTRKDARKVWRFDGLSCQTLRTFGC